MSNDKQAGADSLIDTNKRLYIIQQEQPKTILTISRDGVLTFGDMVTPKDAAQAIMQEWKKLRAQQAEDDMALHALIKAKDAIEAAQGSHGVQLQSYPPQDAWLTNRVDEKLRNAIAAIDTAIAASLAGKVEQQ